MIEILSVASEIYPLIKTGGLADVTGALPAALRSHGVNTRTLVPGYKPVLKALRSGRSVATFDDLFGGPTRLIAGRARGLDLIAIDAPHLYERDGGPYGDPDGHDWPDNWARFAALSWVAAEIARGALKDYAPNVLHAHDWQAALAPVYIAYGPKTDVKTVLTVHNLAFQGQFGAEVFAKLRLPDRAFTMDGIEYYGGVGFLKGGLQCAHMLTTVSPAYATEIGTTEFGMGLDGLINARRDHLVGIINGIDLDAWNPGADPALAKTFRVNSVHQRIKNKVALAKRLGLKTSAGPLFGVVSRLTWQKGIDLLIENIDELVAQGGQLGILGSGDSGLEGALWTAAQRHRGNVAFVEGYDEELAHLIQGGADAILVPSRFEPCGLTQLFGLHYGCIPVVSRVGGLADTIIDANQAALEAGVATGIQFSPVDAPALAEAIRRTIKLFADDKVWKRIQRRGMRTDVSWDASAARYAELYAKLTGASLADD